ncbi:MAG: hypothetical protein ACPL7L_04245, partial [bacterium]
MEYDLQRFFDITFGVGFCPADNIFHCVPGLNVGTEFVLQGSFVYVHIFKAICQVSNLPDAGILNGFDGFHGFHGECKPFLEKFGIRIVVEPL